MQKYFYPIFKLPTFYERDYVKEELPLWVKWWLLGKAGRKLSEILTGSEFTLLHTLNKKFKVFEIKGQTEQDEEPTPESPVPIQNVTGNANVKIQNKNLFDSSNLINWYVNYSEPVGYSSNIYCGINQFFKLKPNTSYTISTKQNVKRLFMPLYDKDYNILRQTVIIDGKQVTFTTNSIEQYAKMCFSLDGTTTMEPNNYKEFIQLEQGSTATSYVPHQEQNYPFSLKSKNLVDISTLEKGYVSATGIITANDNIGERYSKFIKVKPNTNYIFSIIETSSTYNNWFGVGEYSSNNYSSFIKRDIMTTASQSYIQFTTSSTTEYVVVSARNLKDATKIQLEEGTTATDYEPYYDIKAMQGTTFEDDGIHNKRKQYVITGNETWELFNNKCVRIRKNDIKGVPDTTTLGDIKCNYLVADTQANVQTGVVDYGIAIRQEGTNGIVVRNKDFTTLEQYTNWFKQLYNNNAPLLIEYPLADSELESNIIPYNETQATQYNAIKQAYTYKDMTYITSESDELPPELDIQYWKERGTEE